MSSELVREIARYRERSDPSRVSVLERRARLEVIDPLRQAGIALLQGGVYPMLREPQVLEAQGKLWVLMPIEQDPDYASGQFLMPEQVRSDLEAIRARGIDFDKVFIAHEIKQRGTTTPSSFVPSYAALDDLSARLGKMAQTALLAAAAPAALGAAAGAAAGTAAIVLAAGAVMVGGDPVLFAAIGEKERITDPLGYWFGLGRWEFLDA